MDPPCGSDPRRFLDLTVRDYVKSEVFMPSGFERHELASVLEAHLGTSSVG